MLRSLGIAPSPISSARASSPRNSFAQSTCNHSSPSPRNALAQSAGDDGAQSPYNALTPSTSNTSAPSPSNALAQSIRSLVDSCQEIDEKCLPGERPPTGLKGKEIGEDRFKKAAPRTLTLSG